MADPARVEPGVILEPIGLQHAPRIQELASDPEVARTCWIPHPYAEGAARLWAREQLDGWASGTSRWFAVRTPDRGVVGACGLSRIDRARGIGQLSYWIGRPDWGRGFATNAARLVLTHGREQLRLRAVFSCVLGSNLASRRVLEKLDFRLHYAEPNRDPKFHAAESIVFYRHAWAGP